MLSDSSFMQISRGLPRINIRLAAYLSCIVSFLLPYRCIGQSSSPLAFEVLSVKASAKGVDGTLSFGPPSPSGRFTARNMTPRLMIQAAYNLMDFGFTGYPNWVDTEKFDIDAEAGRHITIDECRQMLQEMLKSRFELSIHHESKEQNVMVMTLDRVSEGLKKAAQRAPDEIGGFQKITVDASSQGVNGRDVSMADLTEFLSRYLNQPVMNETALAGRFDLSLRWDPRTVRLQTNSDETGPTIFTALREQLGLRLQARSQKSDILVIDHISRPSPN